MLLQPPAEVLEEYLLNHLRSLRKHQPLGKMTLCIPAQTLLVQTDFTTEVRHQQLLKQQL